MSLLGDIGSFVEEALPVAAGVVAGIYGGPEAGIAAYQGVSAFENMLDDQSQSSKGSSGSGSQQSLGGLMALLNNPEVQEGIASVA